MKVSSVRYAGLFDHTPFKNFIQSPTGLVPKDGGLKTRLIFNISYPQQGNRISVNAGTPQELKTVKYNNFDRAAALCMK